MKQVIRIKECACDEHWVMYGIVESLYSTLETNITLYVNYTGIKIKFLKKKCKFLHTHTHTKEILGKTKPRSRQF